MPNSPYRTPVIALDDVATALPTGTSYTPPGYIASSNGDRILFCKLTVGNGQVYVLGGVGTSITWTLATDGQAGDGSPTRGDIIMPVHGNWAYRMLRYQPEVNYNAAGTSNWTDTTVLSGQPYMRMGAQFILAAGVLAGSSQYSAQDFQGSFGRRTDNGGARVLGLGATGAQVQTGAGAFVYSWCGPSGGSVPFPNNRPARVKATVIASNTQGTPNTNVLIAEMIALYTETAGVWTLESTQTIGTPLAKGLASGWTVTFSTTPGSVTVTPVGVGAGDTTNIQVDFEIIMCEH